MKELIPIFFLVMLEILFNGSAVSCLRENPSHKQKSPQTNDWQGLYTFGEVGGKNTGMVIDYSLKIYQKDGELIADLDADGFQTQTRISCMVKILGNKIQLFFNRYRESNLFDIYKPGELLLSLEARNGRVLTYWEALKPQLISFKNGRVYFTREKRRRAAGNYAG